MLPEKGWPSAAPTWSAGLASSHACGPHALAHVPGGALRDRDCLFQLRSSFTLQVASLSSTRSRTLLFPWRFLDKNAQSQFIFQQSLSTCVCVEANTRQGFEEWGSNSVSLWLWGAQRSEPGWRAKPSAGFHEKDGLGSGRGVTEDSCGLEATAGVQKDAKEVDIDKASPKVKEELAERNKQIFRQSSRRKGTF